MTALSTVRVATLLGRKICLVKSNMPTFLCKHTLHILLKCSQIVLCCYSLRRTNSCVKKNPKKPACRATKKNTGQAIIQPRNRPDRCQRQLCDWSFTPGRITGRRHFPTSTEGLGVEITALQAPNLPPFSTHARQRGGKNNRLYSLWPDSLSLPGPAWLGPTDGHLQLIKTPRRKVPQGDGQRQRGEGEEWSDA